ncbi:MAG: hypothetical protein OXT67_09710, partial [Zetaproteobacteria bacterium]|nr:hypothetical protein [Zetaproteobacteria bacterium]
LVMATAPAGGPATTITGNYTFPVMREMCTAAVAMCVNQGVKHGHLQSQLLLKKEAEPGQGEKAATPSYHPDRFESVRGSRAKIDKQTGEVWERDMLHKDHWEVYKNKKHWEKGKRDRAVWDDGRLKQRF